jgi:type II restriction enzyme
MNLLMTGQLAAGYQSGAQRARVVTEAWGENNLYCPNCSSQRLSKLRNNNKASDYRCPECSLWFQLKGQQSRLRNQICDGGFKAMMDAIRNDATPNFYFLQYELVTWRVKNLLLVPSFAFPPSAIVERKPLSSTARRSGWIGCNIALNRIPADARIAVVAESLAVPESEVRAQFQRLRPLRDIKSKERGWTLDVLNAVRSLCKSEFTNEDAYSLLPQLELLHPGNRHVRDKVRQQLQVLRDSGLLVHLERGRWRIP